MEKYGIGIDIGGTKCAVSIGRLREDCIEVMSREEMPTQETPAATLNTLLPFVIKWKEQYSVQKAGISCGGPLDSNGGIIVCPPNLSKGWHGFPIAEYVRSSVGLTTKLQNDANACALAEWRYGAGRGTKNMVFCTFGTGLGAGLILDGKLYCGGSDNAGEIGHIRLAKTGPVGYGKNGSFEGFCSGGGIVRLAAYMARNSKTPPTYLRSEEDKCKITAKKLSEYALSGDKFARSVFAKSGEMLGRGLSVIVDILNPEVIVLGGVFMRCSELLVPSMKKQLQNESLKESLEICQIVPAKLSENIGDIAAIAVGSEE